MTKRSVRLRASLAVLAFTIAPCAFQSDLAWAQAKPKVIAMTQIAEGFDLDDVRRGIIDAIKKGGFADARTRFREAQSAVEKAAQAMKRGEAC